MPPEPKEPKGNESGKKVALKDAISKLVIRGVSYSEIRKMTQYQLYSAFYALTDEDRFRMSLAGFKVEDGDKEATLQDLLGFGG
ncbi:hypothetical protein [Alicyclobacillus dauci]|uniref:Uncharacterized protein n=1 Tax=Alicyclobacillus dauci TaxID=1475485 RepID=A0ABY6Z5S7_9BACL|nr:hypothetical protein [Alicyclobacillus dauci]WAH38239.1 hypothetical protein NZD86_07090 [Alicyclobacillus dauci]